MFYAFKILTTSVTTKNTDRNSLKSLIWADEPQIQIFSLKTQNLLLLRRSPFFLFTYKSKDILHGFVWIFLTTDVLLIGFWCCKRVPYDYVKIDQSMFRTSSMIKGLDFNAFKGCSQSLKLSVHYDILLLKLLKYPTHYTHMC